MGVDVAGMDYTALVELRDAAEAEIRRRDTLVRAEEQLEQLAQQVHEAKQIPDGTQWVQPVTLGYPKAAVTRMGDAFFRAIVGNNVWRPDDAGAHGMWERVWPDGQGGWVDRDPAVAGPRTWILNMEIQVGDLVSHAGWVWVAKVAHRTHAGWEPSDAAYAVWAKVRPV
ncbi:MAG: hypothetical protein QM286_14170 [Acidobacteriota bacterium]|nr:hypothetical protein [Acidobacteriota bacterium]